MMPGKRFSGFVCTSTSIFMGLSTVRFRAFSFLRALGAFALVTRFSRPVGWLLLFFPCLFGGILGRQGLVPWRDLWVFLLGAWTWRSLGCIYNDWVDQSVDGHVARTRDRPKNLKRFLKSGKINHFLILSFLIGLLGLLAWRLSWPSFFLGAAGVVLIAPYPYLKRKTFLAQVYLGIIFSWGVFLGFFQCGHRSFNLSVLALYGLSFFWVVLYDTVYSYQDLEDDLRLGLYSFAVLFQERGKWFLGLLSGAKWCLWACFSHLQGLISLSWFVGTILLIAWEGLGILYLNLALEEKRKNQCARFFSQVPLQQLAFACFLLGLYSGLL